MMRKILLACPLLLIASAAWAVPVCTTASLSTYTNNDANNFSCTLGGLTFSNFSYSSSNGLPTELNVQVVPTSDAAGDVGFIFNGAFSAGAGTSADAILAYQIADATAGITGATASLISYGASGSGASATIVEGICTTKPAGTGACTPASDAYTLSVFDNAGGSQVQSSSVTFTTPTTTVFMSKNVVEVGGSGSATISSFENTVQTGGGGGPGGGPVPEPASFFTMGSGLIAASFLLRRQLKKQ